MPLSTIQMDVLRLIAANRSPDSYVAGATVLHRTEDTPRYSADLDLFHDLDDSIARSAEADAETLGTAGYELSWLLRTPTFHRAVVRAKERAMKIEWAQDSAFRFYPVQEDERFGYRLHDADAATNKVLALAGRSEIRDFVDVLHLDDSYLPLGALAWAACGKDPGFTPDFLLDHAVRHVAYTQVDLDRLRRRSRPIGIRSIAKRPVVPDVVCDRFCGAASQPPVSLLARELLHTAAGRGIMTHESGAYAMTVPARVMTAEELIRLPDDNCRYALVGGELQRMNPAGFDHGAVIVNLTIPLGQHVKAHRLGVVCGAETGFVLARDPDTVLAPDIAFVRRDRVPATGRPTFFWEGAPDLAVEVTSPGDSRPEVARKVEVWLSAGTLVVWVVDPKHASVAIHEPGRAVRRLGESETLDGAPLLPGFSLPVREIFAL